MVVSLYVDLAAKDLLPDVTFHSFLVQEIAENKSREFPDLELFPLPVSGEDPQSLVPVTERKTDRVIGADDRGKVDLNGILKPSQMIERTHLLFVNSPHCSTKWTNLLPTEISGHGKIGS